MKWEAGGYSAGSADISLTHLASINSGQRIQVIPRAPINAVHIISEL